MLDVFFSTSSILHLCMISFDRYVALALPFRQKSTGSSFSAKSSNRLGIFRFSQNKPKTMKRVARRIALVWTMAFGTKSKKNFFKLKYRCIHLRI